jgi:twinkle protein
MGQCIEKVVHDVPNCGSKSLQVFARDDGGVDGYCFGKCGGTYVRHPYGHEMAAEDIPKPNVKTEEEVARELSEYEEYPTVTLHDRKLNVTTLERYGIKIGMSQQDGITPRSHHYPYKVGGTIQAYKNRVIETKAMWSTGEMKGVDLFGWDVAVQTGAKRLYITEGELDAVSLYQIITKQQANGQFADREPAVVSITRGSKYAAKDISANLEKIRRSFSEVVLVFDQDESGKKAVEETLLVAPDFMTVDLPEHDASDCLVAGKGKAAFAACLWKAAVPKNTRLVWGTSLHEAGRIEAEWGASYPWASLTKLTRGIRFGETIYFGAGVKMGKSELVNAIAAWLITEHGWKVFMAKPEEANRKTYQMVVGKVMDKIFHDPDVPFDYDAYDEGSKKVGDNLAMVNLYQHLGWESLKKDIIAAANEGCQAIFIDPITNLTAGMESGEANVKLQEIAVELSALAMDLNVVVFIFCHLKAPNGSSPHERGGEVLSSQFSGSRAMMRSCNYMIGLEGNKDPDLDEQTRNCRDLVVLEDREFGMVGRVKLFWEKVTGRFRER